MLLLKENVPKILGTEHACVKLGNKMRIFCTRKIKIKKAFERCL
jgi:hypothetical protein